MDRGTTFTQLRHSYSLTYQCKNTVTPDIPYAEHACITYTSSSGDGGGGASISLDGCQLVASYCGGTSYLSGGKCVECPNNQVSISYYDSINSDDELTFKFGYVVHNNLTTCPYCLTGFYFPDSTRNRCDPCPEFDADIFSLGEAIGPETCFKTRFDPESTTGQDDGGTYRHVKKPNGHITGIGDVCYYTSR